MVVEKLIANAGEKCTSMALRPRGWSGTASHL
jgi:hypothetical protein